MVICSVKMFFFQMKIGFVMNILSLCVEQLAVNTWGYYIFGLGGIPDWALAYNNMTETQGYDSINYTSVLNASHSGVQ